jgi:uncharacterized protein (DUF1697 family)
MSSIPAPTTYVAFLRGINVGGNKKIPMTTLRDAFLRLGSTSVKTLLASGNVIFDYEKQDAQVLSRKIESALEKTFGFPVDVIVRSRAQLKKVERLEPFAGIEVTDQTRLYISFLGGKSRADIHIPYASNDKSFSIIKATNTEVFSILDLTKAQTPEAMNILEKTFGKNITTRNWNTIVKIIDSLG